MKRTGSRPDSLHDALALLAEHGDEAKVLAGGQSLIPLMALRMGRPGDVVDISEIDGVAEISVGSDGGVTLGPLVRHEQAKRSAVPAEHAPPIAETMPWVAHRAIRMQGTVLGSIAHADAALAFFGAASTAIRVPVAEETLIRSPRPGVSNIHVVGVPSRGTTYAEVAQFAVDKRHDSADDPAFDVIPGYRSMGDGGWSVATHACIVDVDGDPPRRGPPHGNPVTRWRQRLPLLVSVSPHPAVSGACGDTDGRRDFCVTTCGGMHGLR